MQKLKLEINTKSLITFFKKKLIVFCGERQNHDRHECDNENHRVLVEIILEPFKPPYPERSDDRKQGK